MDTKLLTDWSEAKEFLFKTNFPIHRACRDGDTKYIYDLFTQNTNAKSHLLVEDDYYGWTPAHWAAFFGKLECLTLLDSILSKDVKLAQIKSQKLAQTCGHLAAFGSNPQCLLWLLQSGSDPNAQDHIEDTLLHKAARSGSMECVGLLINNNANIRSVNNQGQSAAILARDNKHQDIAKYLFSLQTKDMKGENQTIHTSSNGYYGFHRPVVATSDEGMETEVTGAMNGISQNGTSNGHCNGFGGQSFNTNGFQHQNGFGQSNGIPQNNGFTEQNGFGHANGFVQQNGFGHANGFVQQNGFGQENGFTKQNVFSQSNGFSQQNGLTHQNGFSQNNGFGQQNGFPQQNGFAQLNGHNNGFGQINGHCNGSPNQNGFGQNGHPNFANIFQSNDVTLSSGSISNITVGGRKRSREDVPLVSDGKRVRMKEPAFDTFFVTNGETKIIEDTNKILPQAEVQMETSVTPVNKILSSNSTPKTYSSGSGSFSNPIPLAGNHIHPVGFRTYCTRSHGGHFF